MKHTRELVDSNVVRHLEEVKGKVRSTSRLARENIMNLKPCVHGGEVWEAARKLGFREEEVLDFSSSVNPLGPSKLSLDAIRGRNG